MVEATERRCFSGVGIEGREEMSREVAEDGLGHPQLENLKRSQ
jgi:hypothetical protein